MRFFVNVDRRNQVNKAFDLLPPSRSPSLHFHTPLFAIRSRLSITTMLSTGNAAPLTTLCVSSILALDAIPLLCGMLPGFAGLSAVVEVGVIYILVLSLSQSGKGNGSWHSNQQCLLTLQACPFLVYSKQPVLITPHLRVVRCDLQHIIDPAQQLAQILLLSKWKVLAEHVIV